MPQAMRKTDMEVAFPDGRPPCLAYTPDDPIDSTTTYHLVIVFAEIKDHFAIDPPKTATIKFVKRILEHITGVPQAFLRLSFRGKPLKKDLATLQRYGIDHCDRRIDLRLADSSILEGPSPSQRAEFISALKPRLAEYKDALYRLTSRIPPPPKPLPPFIDKNGVAVQPLIDLYDLMEPIRTEGIFQVEARLSFLDTLPNSTNRYLMRDGRGYAQLYNVPTSLSFDRGVWYIITGSALGLSGEGPTGVISFLSVVRDTRDIYPDPSKPQLELAIFDEDSCENCGSEEHDDDDCPEPFNPATCECFDCREVGHIWQVCPYLVSPKGTRQPQWNKPSP
ncbi:hypothetical protein BJ508DRAFT_335670 [Ascobolus immersus RN42]|uniref:Ubiquitin-like domain-containing protein n=1 Tax=Ascobolus immersus RN42 TaxID=1160509 RepID=A0A3N4HAX7_ASCIM|nr:hypothetical protein BJ508DRAFT_336514 [Ascobolus immersus RN42]RPA71829.1 hypothetical protein BJ508DRAFT_335670 [Ascobolus immersus RN42]